MGIADEMAAKLRESAAAEQAAAAPADAAPARPRRKATPPPADEGAWAGAVPRAAVARRPLNVGMPTVLNIHHRLALLRVSTGISAHDAAAEALDLWLTEKGIPRDAR